MTKYNKYKLGILKNECKESEKEWTIACELNNKKLEYEVIDLTSSQWLDRLRIDKFDFLVATPPGSTTKFKQLYDERIYIINNYLKIPVYPSITEIFLYENKRLLYSWLAANNLPHPRTWVFYSIKEANNYLSKATYPLVAKVNIGASGSGIKFLHNKNDALNYIKRSFSNKGAPRRWGPNLAKGQWIKRGMNYIFHPFEISKKIDVYFKKKKDIQSGFVLFQKYIPHEYEWRIVVIGDSYFAHKKMKIGEKASGTLLKQYDNPPIVLFNFARKIMKRFDFKSLAIDVFETPDRRLLINELQCIFGQSDPHQMLVNGTPGRYRLIHNKWEFEKGDFNQNKSYNLRVQHILDILDNIRT